MRSKEAKYSDVAKQAVAEKVRILEARNAELEAEVVRLRAQLTENDPVFFLNRLRLAGMQFAYFGDNPDGCLNLIRDEFGETAFKILHNIFHDMAHAPISEDAVKQLREAMELGALGLDARGAK